MDSITPRSTTCKALVVVTQVTCNWNIRNFSSVEAYRNNFFSNPFSANEAADVAFMLSLKTSGEDHEKFSIFLITIASHEHQVMGQFKISFLSDDGEEIYTMSHPSLYFQSHCPAGFEDFISKSSLRHFAFDGVLRIRCEIKYMINEFNLEDENVKRLQKQEIEHELCQDLQKMLNNQELCDIKFVVAEREFGAHKIILAARSPVFAAMFQDEVQEKQNERAIIQNIKPDVFKQLLDFIYSGEIPTFNTNIFDLLVAADIYGLVKLKELCGMQISEHIYIETVAEILIFAHNSNAVYLKGKAIHFITCQAEEVTKTEGWQKLVDSRSPVITEIFVAMARR